TLSIIAGLFVAWWFFARNKSGKLEIVTQPVKRGEIVDVITATGSLKALNTVDVGTQVSGVIDELYVDFNDKVKAGQVIARLDTKTLSANVADAKSNLDRAQLQTQQLKLVYERTKNLYEQKLASKEEFERAEFEYKNAEVNVKMMKVQLDRAAVNLGYASVISPINGVVISRNVSKGQTVAASFTTPTLFTIAHDLTNMLIEADVDEADIGKVKVGQSVEFFVDAYQDQTFYGTVEQIRLQPKTVQSVVNYTVIISVRNETLKLFPGMTANISIVVERKQNIPVVPATALNYVLPEQMPEGIDIMDTTNFDENEFGARSKVWVKEKNRLRAVVIETGITDGSTYEVVKGIPENTEVVTAVEEKKNSGAKKDRPLINVKRR
ncbi:MAG TPA: efflux RND transporter periplasmic adaptor subunit, partial [Flavobacteriales bacterium]|nr:efflux RND transporter periplasmic adaptor subunit [Flavobacteriales bacterium]